MKQVSPAPEREVLAGSVERVTFHNEDNGFCVLRVKARGHRELVTVVGHAATVSAGEWITASGEWVNDRTWGQQFRSAFMKATAPSSAEGIVKYLGSGMIRGIGPVYAKKLVRAFGERVFDVIESESERLREVAGIGPVRADRITAAWAEQKAVREIMMFLHGHGVGTARAVRIFKTYGADAVQVMSENPYRLARDIRGIGFRTADAIAMRLGIGKAAMIRLRAGVGHALTEAMDDGHCGLPAEELLPAGNFSNARDLVQSASTRSWRGERGRRRRRRDALRLPGGLHRAEHGIAGRMRPSRGAAAVAADRADKALPGSSGGPGSRLQAARAPHGLALSRSAGVTGGPGSARPPSSTPSCASWPPRAPTSSCARPPDGPRGHDRDIRTRGAHHPRLLEVVSHRRLPARRGNPVDCDLLASTRRRLSRSPMPRGW